MSLKGRTRQVFTRERLTSQRLAITLAALSAVLISVGLFSIGIGSEHVGFSDVFRVIAAEITGQIAEVSSEHRIIVADIRLPRVLMALVVGAALAVAGSAYQALLRNPLADPGILGISSGAALGAICATIFTESLPISRPVAAFGGAVITIAIVYALGQGRSGSGTETTDTRRGDYQCIAFIHRYLPRHQRLGRSSAKRSFMADRGS